MVQFAIKEALVAARESKWAGRAFRVVDGIFVVHFGISSTIGRAIAILDQTIAEVLADSVAAAE